ncbi:MAG: TonB-dependent receptor, partial [Planctomycetes bacterium]|nr:TonB-dependent receptor [Planctomycetota bacterium]
FGFDAAFSPAGTEAQTFKFFAAVFQRRVEDLIQLVFDARGIGRAVNIARADFEGVEAGFDYSPRSDLSLSCNYTVTDTVIRDATVSAERNKRVPGVAKQSLNARAEYRRGGLKLYGEFQMQDGRYYDKPNLFAAAEKQLVNIGLVWNWN